MSYRYSHAEEGPGADEEEGFEVPAGGGGGWVDFSDSNSVFSQPEPIQHARSSATTASNAPFDERSARRTKNPTVMPRLGAAGTIPRDPSLSRITTPPSAASAPITVFAPTPTSSNHSTVDPIHMYSTPSPNRTGSEETSPNPPADGWLYGKPQEHEDFNEEYTLPSSEENDEHSEGDGKWVFVGCCYLRLWIVHCLILSLVAACMFMLGIIVSNALGITVGGGASKTTSLERGTGGGVLPNGLTYNPTVSPSTSVPSLSPSSTPSGTPTLAPSSQPTVTPSADPTLSPRPSSAPSFGPTFLNIPPSNITVGAYYYPWHGDNFHGGKYLREKLEPRQLPLLGEYDDSDPEIVAQHLAWSRQANIRFWVTSWWGAGRREDTTTRDVILTHKDLGDHKIALFYETTGRIKTNEDIDINIPADISYMCENYFNHPNYLTINGRPALFVYITRRLENDDLMESVVLLMRSVAQNYGYDIWLAGDHVWKDAPADEEFFKPFFYLDAVTNYDVYGSMGVTGYAGQLAVESYYREQYRWKLRSNKDKCGFIPAVSPGFNDRGVRLEADHKPLSRKLTPDSPPGSLFAAGLAQATRLVDSSIENIMLVNSFNEWHEDSQIEPALGLPTTWPSDLTQGLEYVGYGDLYLRLLREATVDDEAMNDGSFANFEN